LNTMDIQNKRIPEGEFEQLRKEVLAQWPTGSAVDLQEAVAYHKSMPASLRPRAADVLVDRTYILAAMGLLSSHHPRTALRIMKKELEFHGYSE